MAMRATGFLAAAVGGAAMGATVGGAAGKPGLAAGAVCGGLAGALACRALAAQGLGTAYHDAEFDDTIGIGSGDRGAAMEADVAAATPIAGVQNKQQPAAEAYVPWYQQQRPAEHPWLVPAPLAGQPPVTRGAPSSGAWIAGSIAAFVLGVAGVVAALVGGT